MFHFLFDGPSSTLLLMLMGFQYIPGSVLTICVIFAVCFRASPVFGVFSFNVLVISMPCCVYSLITSSYSLFDGVGFFTYMCLVSGFQVCEQQHF